jgi:hypothetical protein
MIRTLRRGWQAKHLPTLLTPVVVLAVLGLSWLLGPRANTRLLMLAAMGLAAVVAFIVLSQRPMCGLLALIPAAFLVPIEFGTGTKVAVNAVILLVPFLIAVWLLRMFAVDRQIRLLPSRINTPALLFAVATTVSLIVGNIRWPFFAESANIPAQLGGWALYVFPMGLLLLVGNQMRDVRWLRMLTWVFLALGGLYILGRILPGPLRFSGPLFVSGSVGSMFWTWLVALAFGQFLVNGDLRPRWRWALGLLVAATLFVGWFQGREWLSGWLPPLIAIGVIFWLRSWRWGLAFTIAAGVFLYFFYPHLTVQVLTEEQQYSTMSRAETWPIMYDLVKKSPVLGLGPSNYYHYTPMYPLLGWYVKFNSHNNYWDIAAQTGLVGLAIFAWLAAELGAMGWRVRQRVQDGFSRGYAAGALGGLAGMLAAGWMGDWFLPFTYNIGFPGFRAAMFAWLFLGGLVALERIAKRREGA